MKLLKKLFVATFVLLIVAGTLCAAGQKESDGKLKIVLIPKSVGHPFWADLEKGMEDKAREMGVTAFFHGPQSATASGQISIIEDYLAMGVDGIAIKKYVELGLAQGVQMVTFDTDAPESGRLFYVGTDNVAAGNQGADALIKMMNGKGKVAILTGGLTALNLNQRIEGFEKAAAAYPGIKIVAKESHGDSLEQGLPLMENLLTEYPDIDAFYCVSGPNVAAEGLKSAGYGPGEKIVFGFDIFEPVPTLIRDGYIQGTVAQLPYKEGQIVVEKLVAKINGESVDEIVGTGTNVVTSDNIDEYLKEVH